MSLLEVGQVLVENSALKNKLVELEKLIVLVRSERDVAERKLYNAGWKLTEAEESLQAIEDIEEEMRRDGHLIDPLKPNRRQQVKTMNERERRELEAN
jgi:hypothetical protein